MARPRPYGLEASPPAPAAPPEPLMPPAPPLPEVSHVQLHALPLQAISNGGAGAHSAVQALTHASATSHATASLPQPAAIEAKPHMATKTKE